MITAKVLTLNVHKQTYKFRNTNWRVSVVQLNSHLKRHHLFFTADLVQFFLKNSLQPPVTLSANESKFALTGSRQPYLLDLKRRIMSCNVAATKKYSCFKRNSFPIKTWKRNTVIHNLLQFPHSSSKKKIPNLPLQFRTINIKILYPTYSNAG